MTEIFTFLQLHPATWLIIVALITVCVGGWLYERYKARELRHIDERILALDVAYAESIGREAQDAEPKATEREADKVDYPVAEEQRTDATTEFSQPSVGSTALAVVAKALVEQATDDATKRAIAADWKWLDSIHDFEKLQHLSAIAAIHSMSFTESTKLDLRIHEARRRILEEMAKSETEHHSMAGKKAAIVRVGPGLK